MSKPFSDFMPWAGLVEKGTIITKDGIIFSTFRVTPKDLAFAESGDMISVYRAVSEAVRRISDDGWIIYVDAVRTRESSDLYSNLFTKDSPKAAQDFENFHVNNFGDFLTNEFYITFAYNIEIPLKYMKFSNTSEIASIKKELYNYKAVIADIHGILANAYNTIQLLDSQEMLTMLHSQIAGEYQNIKELTAFNLDYFLCDKDFKNVPVTQVGDNYVQSISVHDFPNETRPDMITAIMDASLEFRFSMRFICMSKDKAKARIKHIRKTSFQKRKSVGAMFGEVVMKEEAMLEDTEALAQTEESSEALSLLAQNNTSFGYLTTTIILQNKSYELLKENSQQVKKILNSFGYLAKDENLNNAGAYLGSFTGSLFNARRLLISSKNLVHLFPLNDVWKGNQINEHFAQVYGDSPYGKCPHIIGKTGNSLFNLNLNFGDVGHTLVVGPTGAGKSILLNTLALQFLRYPDSRIFFFDKDKSSEFACKNCNGLFYDVGNTETKDKQIIFNPFFDIERKEHRIFLSDLIAQYLLAKKIPLAPKDKTELLTAINTMEGMSLDSLNFGTLQGLIQDTEIRSGLDAFSNGEYTPLFGSVEDKIADSRWITYEMNVLMSMDENIVQFILGYLFNKLQAEFKDTPTILVLDEAWLFLDNDFFATQLRDWLKTLRKKNCYVIIATQETADLANSVIFSTVLNACMTRIMLPNAQASSTENKKLYHDMGLDDDDIWSLENAKPKKEYLLRSPKGKQLFELCLEKNQLDILKSIVTNTNS